MGNLLILKKLHLQPKFLPAEVRKTKASLSESLLVISANAVGSNKNMQPILAADSFRLNSGDFQIQSVGAVSFDAAKSADDLVIRKKEILKQVSFFCIY